MKKKDDKNFDLDFVTKAIESEDYKAVLEMTLPFVKKNDPKALATLAFCYHFGFGVPRDGIKALELYKKAIDLGSGVAAHNLGTLYLSDLPGVPKDGKLSKYYYRKAKEMGAQFANDEFYE